MSSFADRAFAAKEKAVKEFGTYAYGDKGAQEVMDTDVLVTELKKMPFEDIKKELLKLSQMDDIYPLMAVLVGDLDDQDWFDRLLEEAEPLQVYY